MVLRGLAHAGEPTEGVVESDECRPVGTDCFCRGCLHSLLRLPAQSVRIVPPDVSRGSAIGGF